MGQTASQPTPTPFLRPRKPPIPYLVWFRIASAMCDLERKGGLTSEGIYRVPGLGTLVSKGLRYLMEGPAAGEDISDLHKDEWASCIKAALWSYEPITAYAMYDVLVAAASKGVDTLLPVLDLLSPAAREKLDFIVERLARVAQQSSLNNMGVTNLARLWGGILVRPDDNAASDLGLELQMAARQYVFASVLLERKLLELQRETGPYTTPELLCYSSFSVSCVTQLEGKMTSPYLVKWDTMDPHTSPEEIAATIRELLPAPESVDVDGLVAATLSIRMERERKPATATGSTSRTFRRRASNAATATASTSAVAAAPSISNTTIGDHGDVKPQRKRKGSFMHRASALFSGTSLIAPERSTPPPHTAPEPAFAAPRSPMPPARSVSEAFTTPTQASHAQQSPRLHSAGGRFDAAMIASAIGEREQPRHYTFPLADGDSKETEIMPESTLKSTAADSPRSATSDIHSPDKPSQSPLSDDQFKGKRFIAAFPGEKPPPPRTPKPHR